MAPPVGRTPVRPTPAVPLAGGRLRAAAGRPGPGDRGHHRRGQGHRRLADAGPAAGRVRPGRLAGAPRGCQGVACAVAPRSTPGRCPADSSPTPRSCSSAAPCCSRPASSPTSSASSSSCRSPDPIARTLLEAAVAKRLLGGFLGGGGGRGAHGPAGRTSSRARSSSAARTGTHRHDEGRAPEGDAAFVGSVCWWLRRCACARGFSPRDSRSRVSRSSSSSSSSGIERRSRSMSQWVRTCLTCLASGSGRRRAGPRGRSGTPRWTGSRPRSRTAARYGARWGTRTR